MMTLVSELKDHVTTFSAYLKDHFHEEDEVRVGGQIISIVDFADLLDNTNEQVYIELDDSVGSIMTIIPKEVYDEAQKAYSFKEGDLVIAVGKLHILDLATPYQEKAGFKNKDVTKFVNHHPEKDRFRVACWDIHLLSAELEEPVG